MVKSLAEVRSSLPLSGGGANRLWSNSQCRCSLSELGRLCSNSAQGAVRGGVSRRGSATLIRPGLSTEPRHGRTPQSRALKIIGQCPKIILPGTRTKPKSFPPSSCAAHSADVATRSFQTATHFDSSGQHPGEGRLESAIP